MPNHNWRDRENFIQYDAYSDYYNYCHDDGYIPNETIIDVPCIVKDVEE